LPIVGNAQGRPVASSCCLVPDARNGMNTCQCRPPGSFSAVIFPALIHRRMVSSLLAVNFAALWTD